MAGENLTNLMAASSKKTSILGDGLQSTEPVAPATPTVDLGVIRPWRIALVIARVQVELIINLTEELTVGRWYPRNAVQPNIDLKPFNAEELGVSRQHMFIRLEGDSVVIIDNASSNGTRLNGQRLTPRQPYPLQHGDKLALGALEMSVELLINPLD